MTHERLPLDPQRAVTQEDRLRFAIRFAQMPLDTMRVGDWLNLREDFAGFLMLTSNQPYANRTAMEIVDPTGATLDLWQPRLSMGMMGCPDTHVSTFTEDEFRALQADVLAWFHALTHPEHAGRVPIVAVRGEIALMADAPMSVQAPVRDFFLWHVLVLLLQEPPDRVRRCPECGALFYRVKHQAYCSRPCGNKVTQRRWREKHSLRAAVLDPVQPPLFAEAGLDPEAIHAAVQAQKRQLRGRSRAAKVDRLGDVPATAAAEPR